MNFFSIFNYRLCVIALILSSHGAELFAGSIGLETTPLFTTNSAKPNLILSIDDSGSMDFEMLFDSTDGNLWWETTTHSVVDPATGKPLKTADYRYIYLFPNGTGTARRVYGDSTFYALPPLPQFAFARNSEYNNMYYDPNIPYTPWTDYGLATFGNIDPSNAPSDPVTGTGVTVDLTQDIQSDASDYTFKTFKYTWLPIGTIYSTGGGNWITVSGKSTYVGANSLDLGLVYFPATYYKKVTSGAYSINGVTGDCSTPNKTHYTTFENYSTGSSLSGVDALAPDGICLAKVEIKPATTTYAQNGSRTDCADPTFCTYSEEIQNFANWYSYYRKRHLALRAGMGQAFDNLSGLRTGLFTINNLSNVTMYDVDVTADYDNFYKDLYKIDGNYGGTPNRDALNHAGKQFMRTDASAPITEACQKNFTLAFTDGYTTPSGPSVGNQDDGKGVPYADTYSNTFADIAIKYYNNVLRSDLKAGLVPTAIACNSKPVDPQLDCNKNLHMNTFTVGFGALGQSIYGLTHNSVADAYSNPPSWPDVTSIQDGRQIDDFYHGAVNGRGEMYSATAPQELASKLSSALQGIQAKVGVASAVTFNTATLETNSAVYLAFFNSGNWSGDLVSFPLDGLGNIDLSSAWSAATLLDSSNPSPGTRVILTQNGASGVGFRWSNLNTYQQADLNSVPGGNGQAGLDFIRGDRSNEGSGKFRVRGSILGDIVHSSPVFVGKPNIGWPDTAPFPTTAPNRYLDFKTDKIANPRTEVVYFGSNDGILHGVQASDGKEILAYIPENLFSTNTNEGLHYLAEPQYQHRYFVDLSPTVSDVYIDRNGTNNYAWHTILVGGQRAGGRGIFALDITDPTQFSETKAADLVLWEFTHSDIGGNLGFTYSKPTIAMMENGRWAAIFGNGYNDTGSGEAKLFIVFIDGGLDGSWTDGSGSSDLDYIVLTTNAGSSTTPNGLATPAVVDIDGNGAADRVYAGDLQGNLWAFDLSDTSALGLPNKTPAWKSAYVKGSTPVPLFVAKDASNNLQPITSKPSIVFHPSPPSGKHEPNVLVFFGTGKYLEKGDLTSTSIQSLYGVWDEGSGDLRRNNLVQQNFSEGIFTDSDGNARTDLRIVSDNDVNYTNKHGWYIDLDLISGERVVVSPVVRGSLVFFNTWIPDSSACASGGKGFLLSVEQLNGGEPDGPAFNVNSTSIVDDTDVVTDSSKKTHAPAGESYNNGLPAQSTFLSNKQYTPGTGSKVIETREVADLGGFGTGRLSWQQLN